MSLPFPKCRILLSALALILILPGCAEIELASHVAKQTPSASAGQGTFKVGTPYKIQGKVYEPQERYNFTETGIASWYGKDFHGKRTANGEIYNMNELTAAHKTLQMPSLVRVTNLENGRSVIVRINDRGPFSRGRVLDVSMKTAELLGFKNKGTAKIKLQVLADESRKIAEVARSGKNTRGYEVAMNEGGQQVSYQPGSSPTVEIYSDGQPPVIEQAALQHSDIQTSIPGHVTQGRFYPDQVVTQLPVTPTNIFVQVGSFANSENAQRLATSLRPYGSSHVQTALVNGQQYYRVRIGPVPNVPQADTLLNRLSGAGQTQAIVVVD